MSRPLLDPGARLDDESFRRLQVLLHSAAGLVVDDARRDSLDASVAERMRATGTPTAAGYLDRLLEPVEQQRLLDEVTVQETHFFRNVPQMLALQSRVLPELLRHAASQDRRLRIWSAGCSTGEEAYSLAVLLRELLPRTDGWDVRVLATDLSQSALATARAATYGARSLQHVSAERLARFFVPEADGRRRLRPEVRELVELRHHNLVREEPPRDRQDLVLCRNVTIYFDRETTRAVIDRLHGSLRDGGYLLLGHSETLWRLSDAFTLVPLGAGKDAAYVYRRSPVIPAARRPPGERPDRPAAVRRSPHPLGRPRTEPRPAPDVPPVEDATPAIREALASGGDADAARLARAAAVVDPLRAELHYLLGRALADSGLDDEALPALRRAVYLDPSAGLAHFLLAGALARSGDAAAAAREHRAAAHALHRSPGLSGAPELGGRSPAELADLCEQLDQRLSGGPG